MTESKQTKKGPLKRVLFFLKFLEIRLRFVVILVLTALVVGYWDHIQNYWERWQRERTADEHAGHADEAASSEYEYYCGMHPFVVRDRPGKCPICGMDLTQRKKGEAMTLPEGTVARVQASPERVMQAGVRTEPVLYRLLSRTVRSYGVIEPDETLVQNVVARFPGRVEDLLVAATGQQVTKGEALARIYSPQYLAGADEYVRALQAYRRLQSNPNVNATEKQRANRLVEGARSRLLLAGFTESQLEAVAKGESPRTTVTLHSPVAGTVMQKNVLEGQTVEEGTPIYTVADLSRLWVQVQVIESELAAVKLGMPVEVTTVSWPGEIFYGTVDFIYPEVNPQNRSVKVRVVVDNPDSKLRPGMYADAVMRAPVGRYGPSDSMLQVARADYNEQAPAQAQPAADTEPAPVAAPPSELPTTTPEAAQQFLASLPDGAKYYVCPMDPEVVTNDPSHRCPLCKMKLTEAVKGEPTAAEAAHEHEAEAQAAGGALPTSTQAAAEKFMAALPAGAKYFTCTMDPEVVSDKPGECPLCGMDLVESTKPETAGPHGGTYERWAEGYACGMHPDELADKPGVCTICACGMDMKKLLVERVLSVPESAVIDTGTQKIVYVETEPGLYDARTVTLGPRTGHYFPVIEGLTLGQKIVTDGSFLIDAEARLNPSVSGMGSTQETQQAPADTHAH